jgi:hypothetical protein
MTTNAERLSEIEEHYKDARLATDNNFDRALIHLALNDELYLMDRVRALEAVIGQFTSDDPIAIRDEADRRHTDHLTGGSRWGEQDSENLQRIASVIEAARQAVESEP